MNHITIPAITEHTTTSARHTTAYLACEPLNLKTSTPVIFVHGWPELSWSWRHQLPHFASLGYRCYAPDMRGYGDSSNYTQHSDFAQIEIVQDMLELLDHIGANQAIWVGHDWGSPTVWNLATHHPDRCAAVASLCVPFNTLERGWEHILPLIDRSIYPAERYPSGQWEYLRYYEERFDDATATFDSNPFRVAKILFRKGDARGCGKPAATASTRKLGGWFQGDEIPDVPHDEDILTEEDLHRYASALQKNSFFGPDAYYMNHALNAAYANTAVSHSLTMPVLFLHARYDHVCETIQSKLADPMRKSCANLTEAVVDSGHWMAQEQPDAVNRHLAAWLVQQRLFP